MTTAGTSGDGAGSGCAIINQTVTGWSGTNTITVIPSSSPIFYRLYGPGSTKILGFKNSGTNLVINYKWQTP